jgi:hypothetical protein
MRRPPFTLIKESLGLLIMYALFLTAYSVGSPFIIFIGFSYLRRDN